jgi:RNA polymerase sigma factor (sigma-70 family)
VEAARTDRDGRPGRGPGEARVSALLARHGPALMRVARQASLCHDDAMDALQRALEIYVRRLDHVEIATEAAWIKVVIRHEAYAIRRARGDCVAAPDVDLDAVVAAPERSVEERVESGDRVSRSAQALRALKPDEARALMLKAHGLSYEEIGRHCGWTYTKVNRCITEGRRRFMEAYAELESGGTCERFAPGLAALAAGTATSEQLLELRPHLRACSACRATVRDLHVSARRRLRALGPIPAFGWLWERLRGTRTPDPAAVGEPHTTIERIHPIVRVKADVTQLLTRAGNPDLANGVQIAIASGLGRVATVGAIAGLCLSGLGAGTVCLVRGVSPLAWLHPDPPPARVHHAAPKPTATPGAVATVAALPPKRAALRPVLTPSPMRAPAPAARSKPDRSRRAAADPSQGTAPSSQQHAPISPARAATTEFAAAPAGGSGGAAAAAPAPPTGGNEFGP